MTLIDLGLTLKKNTFEIHEKNGPPKRVDKEPKNFEVMEDFYGYKGSNTQNNLNNENLLESVNYTSLIDSSFAAGCYPPRRNGVSMQTEPSSEMDLSLPTSYSYSDDENTGFVGLINQAMTCYLNSLLQTLYMTPEFRNAIYRYDFLSIFC